MVTGFGQAVPGVALDQPVVWHLPEDLVTTIIAARNTN